MNSQERIGPTAWGIAYRRASCDVSYAKEILDELVATLTPDEQSQMEALVSEKDQALTPQFEARYKLLNKLLRTTGIDQIMEIAAGIAPRGFEMTEDPSVTYVETDLPGILEQKKLILDRLVLSGATPRPHLYLEPGDALSLDDLTKAAVHFSSQEPIAILHEGLMRYLSFDEKRKVANNVKTLLETFGGVYITPDITLRVFMDERVQNVVSQMVGMDINKNAFENVANAKQFFQDIGFSVEQHSFTEIRDELVSPERLHLTEEQVEKAIGAPVFFVMRLR